MIHRSIVLRFITLLHQDRCRIAPLSAREGQDALRYGQQSALRRFDCGEQGCIFRLRLQPVAQGWANHMLKRSRQYSSASMIVITRLAVGHQRTQRLRLNRPAGGSGSTFTAPSIWKRVQPA